MFVISANTAAAAGGILFYMSYVPYFFIQPQYSTLSWITKIMLCLVSNIAMSLGANVIGLFEGTGKQEIILVEHCEISLSNIVKASCPTLWKHCVQHCDSILSTIVSAGPTFWEQIDQHYESFLRINVTENNFCHMGKSNSRPWHQPPTTKPNPLVKKLSSSVHISMGTYHEIIILINRARVVYSMIWEHITLLFIQKQLLCWWYLYFKHPEPDVSTLTMKNSILSFSTFHFHLSYAYSENV